MRLEQRVTTGVDALLRDREQRTHVGVQLVLRAVIGVQRDGDVVLCRDHVCELGERNSAGDHVLDAQTGTELGAARRELDDAVTAGVREALDAALMDSEPTQLMAGKAKECSLARPSISA